MFAPGGQAGLFGAHAIFEVVGNVSIAYRSWRKIMFLATPNSNATIWELSAH